MVSPILTVGLRRSLRSILRVSLVVCLWVTLPVECACSQQTTTAQPPTDNAVTESESAAPDPLRQMQLRAMETQHASWGHWGNQPQRYSSWINHSNRLIPLYTFGITLDTLRDEGSVYADPQRLEQLYGQLPAGTYNPTAMYFDQTDVYRLQLDAVEAGYRNIILMIFDGLDWQTTRATAIYQQKRVTYRSGRGNGLAFQDERRTPTDFGLICTSPKLAAAKFDVNSQTVLSAGTDASGGYDPVRGGEAPWQEQSRSDYLLGLDRERPHTVTDSASSATSLMSGIKTYNGAINFAADGSQLIPLARRLQTQRNFKIGVVTNVPISHATPAGAYANNVTRSDYQDIARDMLGLPSASHRQRPLPGVDVLIGAGWGEEKSGDTAQGDNFLVGNRYLHDEDLRRVDVENGGEYIVAQRTQGKLGTQVLMEAARRAANEDRRLLGWFGTKGGHLPYQTADGGFNPTFDMTGIESYTRQDIDENPTLAEMTQAALLVLERAPSGFWLLVEAGDIDWANHSNNLDNSIGAVLSGEAAFNAIVDWIDQSSVWDETALIVASDHGHFLVLDDEDAIARAGQQTVQAGD